MHVLSTYFLVLASQQQKMALSLGLLLSLLAVAKLSSAATCYDHQTTDYSSRFEPAECGQTCTVTPFFSPDHSLDVYLDVINSATESIDIFTPGIYHASYASLVSQVLQAGTRLEQRNGSS